uniref:Aspartyl/asparaginy/proline hydroxylase domain-containing protein n=1 Tax=Strigamia maritima TaxID=126957 RepID=T1J2K7_STRMM
MTPQGCSSVFLCEQNEDVHTGQLFIALLFGVFVSVLIWYGHKWFSDTFQSNCSSKSCIRCHSTGTIHTNALKRFHELEKSTSIDITVRIKLAVTNGGKQNLYKYPTQKPNILYIPNLNTKGWLDSREYYLEDTKALRRGFQVISEEFETVFTIHRSNWIVNRVPSGQWSMFYFMNQGEWVKKNCQLCPKTVAILKSLKNFMDGSVFANSGFSVMMPHTEIDPHFGPTNARLRCHLALKVTNKSTLCVDNETRNWKTAKCLLFDDSFIHFASHKGNYFDGPRAILMVDLWNPWLTLTERYIVQKCYSPTD